MERLQEGWDERTGEVAAGQGREVYGRGAKREIRAFSVFCVESKGNSEEVKELRRMGADTFKQSRKERGRERTEQRRK